MGPLAQPARQPNQERGALLPLSPVPWLSPSEHALRPTAPPLLQAKLGAELEREGLLWAPGKPGKELEQANLASLSFLDQARSSPDVPACLCTWNPTGPSWRQPVPQYTAAVSCCGSQALGLQAISC